MFVGCGFVVDQPKENGQNKNESITAQGNIERKHWNLFSIVFHYHHSTTYYCIRTEVRHTNGPVREQVHINRNFIFASSMDDFGWTKEHRKFYMDVGYLQQFRIRAIFFISKKRKNEANPNWLHIPASSWRECVADDRSLFCMPSIILYGST